MQISDLVYIDDTGFHFADYPTFLQYRIDQYRSIYGADAYLEPDSQDGQYLAILALDDYNTAAYNASVFNSFSPVTAQGVGLARQVKINGLSKRSASRSTADLLITGQGATIIVNGVAQDTLDQKWNIPTTTIPGGGSITVTAVAQEIGAVNAGANSINKIFTPTLGWQSVNNVAAATPGAPVETDAELRVRQQASTANPSLTVLDGQVGAVENIPGVTKAIGYQNDTGSTDANGIPAHKISIVVNGGDAQEVANIIALHKTPGVGTYGTTTETVYDSHGMPLLIAFFRPTIVSIKVQITISTDQGWSNDFVPLIQDAVAAVINANKIGATVLITKLYAPAYLLGTPAGSTFDIATLEIGKNSDPLDTINIPLLFNEEAVCIAASDVTVIVT